ncbi:hypothetical protein ACFU6I_11410 [Streptomyces sp. NPDC057486]|uniref:hypothetical protein n=1 Tax=Streptomyces sp. NPDC057486 TaxID=3346145 RepID=UPI0036B0985A
MNAAGRLALYGAGLAVAFTGALGISAVAVPDSVVADWKNESTTESHGDMTDKKPSMPMDTPAGLSASADGYVLTSVSSPEKVGDPGELSFQIQNRAGDPLLGYKTAHEKQLHLIVVRSDGTRFRHVHPTLDKATGTWSVPWKWDTAGTYRIYTDFTPKNSSDGMTLTSTVDVAGQFTPDPAKTVSTTDEVDGFTASVDGDLVAGKTSELTVRITRDGKSVTTLQPYLGAYGHLVALREGDLAYLHVHAQGEEPSAGETTGPEISFGAEAPNAGRYLLYLDFKVDGKVHTAKFALDATRGDGADTDTGTHDTSSHGH